LAPLPSGPRKGGGKLDPFFAFFVELIEQDELCPKVGDGLGQAAA
jgi:hypothetical protein